MEHHWEDENRASKPVTLNKELSVYSYVCVDIYYERGQLTNEVQLAEILTVAYHRHQPNVTT